MKLAPDKNILGSNGNATYVKAKKIIARVVLGDGVFFSWDFVHSANGFSIHSRGRWGEREKGGFTYGFTVLLLNGQGRIFCSLTHF